MPDTRPALASGSLQDAYVDEVLRFRRALNLTSISDRNAFHRRFIVPSLAMAGMLPEAGRLLDVGSGMGVPGIPLLIGMPALEGVLVERRLKRAEFLRHVVRRLGLHATVHAADIDDLPCLNVDVCVARAVADQARLLTMFARHAKPGAWAVFPAPRSTAPADGVSTAGGRWRWLDESRVEAGDVQVVRRYVFEAAE